MKITTEVEISNERISDLLCSAFEGGSTYWAVVKSVEGRDKAEYIHDVPLNGGKILISDQEGDLSTKSLDMSTIESGLHLMAKKFPRHFTDFINENDDACTGDVFLQCCLFDDVIYG